MESEGAPLRARRVGERGPVPHAERKQSGVRDHDPIVDAKSTSVVSVRVSLHESESQEEEAHLSSVAKTLPPRSRAMTPIIS